MSDATWNGAQAAATMAAAGARGLNKAAERLAALALELTPEDTGDLKDGQSVIQAKPTDLEAGVVYNSPGGYAVPQHERLDFVHVLDKNPKARSKYLEAPLIEQRDQLNRIIQAEIRRAL